jgi:hypothetical protein
LSVEVETGGFEPTEALDQDVPLRCRHSSPL